MITPSASGAHVPRLHLAPSASFRSKTGRDSYLTGFKKASHDASIPNDYSPPPKGGATAAFRSTTPRDSYMKADAKRFGESSANVPSDFDLSSRSKSPSAAFRPGRSDRDSYIRAAHKVTSEGYDVPGMAEEIMRKKSGFGLMRGKTERDSYLRDLKGRFGESSANVKGIGEKAEEMRRSSTPTAAFRGNPGKGRDSYLRDAKSRSLSDYPNVPGLAETIARKPGGRFLGGNGSRDSYIRASPKPVDAVYDVPGVADKAGSIISSGYSFKTSGDRHSYLKAAKREGADTYYDVPGIAESARRSTTPCSANSSFRSTGQRHSYLQKERKFTEASYNVPGMSDSICSSPSGRWSKSPAHRDSHIRAQHKFVDATYDIPGIAELNGSMALSGSFVSAVRSPQSSTTPRQGISPASR